LPVLHAWASEEQEGCRWQRGDDDASAPGVFTGYCDADDRPQHEITRKWMPECSSAMLEPPGAHSTPEE
jgi:hypothetical protein